MELGLIAGFWVGGSTILGSLLTFFRPSFPGADKLSSMDFALGMMLSAAAFSLLLPAAQTSWTQGLAPFFGTIMLALFGAGVMYGLSQLMQQKSGALLFVVAMMLHNFPEGLAAGAAFKGLTSASSLGLVGAIMLQNIPEGFMTVLAFRSLGLDARYARVGAIASGLIEVLGGGIGGAFVHHAENALPFILAVAGGAMLQVTIRELLERVKLAPPKLPERLFSGMAFMIAVGLLGSI